MLNDLRHRLYCDETGGQHSYQELLSVGSSSMVGTAIEFYDFFIYGTASALIFPHLFFPSLSPLAGIIASYGSMAVTFLSRPIGAIVFGHYGDKKGRKSVLILALLLMGLATFLIGCIPTYESIGIAAPVLLIILRLVQGFALGGEWGGATTMLVEYAPAGHRGFFGTFVQMGNVVGLFLSTGVVALIPSEIFLTWGWRIPFLLSIVILGIGMFIRLHVKESPVFEALQNQKAKSSEQQVELPLKQLLKSGRKQILVAMGMRMGEIVLGFTVCTYIMSYVTHNLGLDRSIALNAVLCSSAIALFTFPMFGAISDKVGRRPVYLFGSVLTLLFAFPLFWLVDSGSVPVLYGAIIFAYSIGLGAMFSVQPAFFSELFQTGVRYTGISLGFQMAGIVGGLTPMIATMLVDASGGHSWPISAFLALMCMISILCVYLATETFKQKLSPEINHLQADDTEEVIAQTTVYIENKRSL